MRRRDFITLLPGAALPGAAFVRPSQVEAEERGAGAASPVRVEVDIKRDFGAKGDGVTDDWIAIENAGRYLERLGGGRMYFPAGRYRLPNFGFNIRARSNIEYCGDGYASWIDANNCAFCNTEWGGGRGFTVGDFPLYRYFAAADVVAGQRSVTCREPDAATNFSPGDFIYVRSISELTAGKEVWPYFSEYSRVTASDPATGVVTLEDAFEDGWSGVQVAKLTSGLVAANYSIHHLRLTCSAGYPIFIMASYKAKIHDVWTEGWGGLTVNAFTRSEFRNSICEINWQPGSRRVASPIEIETGSVRAVVENVTCNIRSLDGTQNAGEVPPLVFTQEFSRRTTIRNCRFLAPGMELGNGVFSLGAGHCYDGLTFVGKSFDNILRFVCNENLAPLTDVARSARDLTVDVSHGYKCAVGLIGTERAPCANVTVDGLVVNGASGGGASIVFTPSVRSVLLNKVDADGKIYRYGDGPIIDVALHNSRTGGFADSALRDLCDVVNFRRHGSPAPPALVTSGDRLVFSNVARSVFSSLSIPPDMHIEDGDSIDIHASIYKFKGPHKGHVIIRAFGVAVEAIDIAGTIETYIDIRARVLLRRSENGTPRALACLGTLTSNNQVRNLRQSEVGLDPKNGRTVALEVWGDWPGNSDNISVRWSRLSYELAENKTAF